MGNPRKDDESVQTSLRALMEEEEARVRAENERLEQLRAAKMRLDRERAEAALEEEERRALEREAVKVAAVERARIEALAKAEADRRAEERARAVPIATPPPPAPPAPKRSRLLVGLVLGVLVASSVGVAAWKKIGDPRIASETERATSAWRETENAGTRARDAERALAEERDANRKDVDALRGENERMRRAMADAPKCVPTATAPARHTTRARCDPHDPLCADL